MLLLAVSFTAALGAPPVHVTEGPTPSVRLDEQCVTAAKGTVEVPIWVKNHGGFDGVQVTIDYDEVFLGYAWYRTASPSWRVERVAPYGQRRIKLVLRQNQKDQPVELEKEEVALYAVFYLKDLEGKPEARPFKTRTGLRLGTETQNGNIDTYFFTVQAGQDRYRPAQTQTTHGGVTIYYREGVELDGGRLTRAEQTFRLPLYLTYLAARDSTGAPRTITVAIDYDEVFLGLAGLMGLRPPLEGAEAANPIEAVAETRGSVIFDLKLAADAPASGCRVHVADVFFTYSGEPTNLDQLVIEPAILEDGSTDLDPAAHPDGGAGASTPGSAPGVLGFLPSHLVRGNVDSSVTMVQGIPQYRPDPGDVMRILDSIFGGGRALPCLDAADANDNGKVELSDAVHILNYLFRGGPAPLAPYPGPGIDPTVDDELGCEQPVPVFVPTGSTGRNP